jgi:hypothetical protein
LSVVRIALTLRVHCVLLRPLSVEDASGRNVHRLAIDHLSRTITPGHAIAVFTAVAYGVVILAALTLPETRGRQLSA